MSRPFADEEEAPQVRAIASNLEDRPPAFSDDALSRDS
jgi:hypothetical protein